MCYICVAFQQAFPCTRISLVVTDFQPLPKKGGLGSFFAAAKDCEDPKKDQRDPMKDRNDPTKDWEDSAKDSQPLPTRGGLGSFFATVKDREEPAKDQRDPMKDRNDPTRTMQDFFAKELVPNEGPKGLDEGLRIPDEGLKGPDEGPKGPNEALKGPDEGSDAVTSVGDHGSLAWADPGQTLSDETLDDETLKVGFYCERCGFSTAEDGEAEHADHHFAADLQVRIFSVSDILLVPGREYSPHLTSYWSLEENILRI